MKLILILLLFPVYAFADTVGLHIGSQHTPDPGGRANNLNPGLYYKMDNGATVGFYKNSVNRDSVYLGYTTPELWRVSAFMGAINGYGLPNNGWLPLVIPTVRIWNWGDTALRLAYIPKVDDKGQEIYHLMIERKF